MTRLDADAGHAPTSEGPVAVGGRRTLLLESREVPLGGVRAMSVRRSLPQRDLPMVGAWCFLDRFGPQDARMRVEPHPHIGLQTVTWPFVGDVRHRDAVGSDVIVRRGALNLMTSGAGIAHSEYSVGEDPVPLDALQLWVALPEARRHGDPSFEQHEELPVVSLEGGGEATIVLGELSGVISPATVHTPIVGAEVRIPAGANVRIPLRAEWEHAVIGCFGEASVAADCSASLPLDTSHLLSLGSARESVEISSIGGATVFLLGGEPFEADIVMWWNFVGRTHDEIVEAREDWESGRPRFGHVVGHGEERIPAPPLPGVRLTARRRRD